MRSADLGVAASRTTMKRQGGPAERDDRGALDAVGDAEYRVQLVLAPAVQRGQHRADGRARAPALRAIRFWQGSRSEIDRGARLEARASPEAGVRTARDDQHRGPSSIEPCGRPRATQAHDLGDLGVMSRRARVVVAPTQGPRIRAFCSRIAQRDDAQAPGLGVGPGRRVDRGLQHRTHVLLAHLAIGPGADGERWWRKSSPASSPTNTIGFMASPRGGMRFHVAARCRSSVWASRGPGWPSAGVWRAV